VKRSSVHLHSFFGLPHIKFNRNSLFVNRLLPVMAATPASREGCGGENKPAIFEVLRGKTVAGGYSHLGIPRHDN